MSVKRGSTVYACIWDLSNPRSQVSSVKQTLCSIPIHISTSKTHVHITFVISQVEEVHGKVHDNGPLVWNWIHIYSMEQCHTILTCQYQYSQKQLIIQIKGYTIYLQHLIALVCSSILRPHQKHCRGCQKDFGPIAIHNQSAQA